MCFLIDSYKSHVRRSRVLAFPGQHILRVHFDAHLHRSMEYSVHLRFQHHNFAKTHRIPEIDVIHRSSHHIAVRMAMRRHRRGDIDQVHHVPTQQFSQRICLRRQNNLGHFRTRRTHWFSSKSIIGSLLRFLSFHIVRFRVQNYPRHRYNTDVTMSEQKKTRRQMLEEFVSKKPDDAFSRYGLAMECMNSVDPTAADQHFRALLQRNADYIPAYLMYGQLLARESRTSEAKQILSNGIAAAAKKGDQHASSEMEALLNELA